MICTLCPRRCGVDRRTEPGFCGERETLRIARAAPHHWEEPPISGTGGSGTIFFSGCSLRCVFCQNHEIAVSHIGCDITPEALADTMLRLQSEGVHNINLVTGTHFTPQIVSVLHLAKQRGLSVPIVWNSGGYELPETLRMLDGLVDIYLPDFKYISADIAAEYSQAPDYPEVAKAALAEMIRQRGAQQFDADGMMQSGVQVRHLVLPGHAQESRKVLYYLWNTYGSRIGISIMNQYTPMPQCKEHPLLSRRVTEKEYENVLRYAEQLGIENAFTQEGEAAAESFIPQWTDSPDQL